MKLPANFDDVPESDGDLQKPPPGSYICKVVHVQYTNAKSGRPMLVIDFDIDHGPFAGFFARDNDDRSDKNLDQKWIRLYQLVDGTALGRFKKLLKDFERSNDDFSIAKYTDTKTNFFDEQSLVNRRVGLVCDGEEYTYNSRVFMSLHPTRSRSSEKVEKGEVPKPRIKGVDGTWRDADQRSPPLTKPGTNELEHVDDIEIPF